MLVYLVPQMGNTPIDLARENKFGGLNNEQFERAIELLGFSRSAGEVLHMLFSGKLVALERQLSKLDDLRRKGVATDKARSLPETLYSMCRLLPFRQGPPCTS